MAANPNDANPNDTVGKGFGKELASLDFSKLIGGPLIATINAQAASAMVTLNFIQKVGFKKDSGGGGDGDRELATVNFTFKKQMPAPGGTGTIATDQEVTVPMLSIVPIPFLRVDELLIDLNVKLHSTQTQSTENTFDIKTDDSVSEWFSPISLNVSSSDKNVEKGSTMVDRQYSIGVKVHAVQDTMPGGLAKMLNIFEEIVQAQAKDATTTAPSR